MSLFSKKEMEKINRLVGNFGDSEAIEALSVVSDEGYFTIYKSSFWTVVVEINGEMKSAIGETLVEAVLDLLGWLEHDELLTLRRVK